MTLIPGSSCRRILLIAVFAILGWRHSSAQTYCRPALGSCCEWISNVALNTINHNTVNEPGYADYTTISTVITKGTTYPISVKVSTNTTFVEHVKIYFDWDRDYVFESAVYLGSAKFKGNNVFSGEVTVPPNALDGCSMMRVFMQYAVQPTGACSSDGDGEVEDYTLVVSNSSVPIANFPIPTETCKEFPISFISSSVSDGSALSYLWNFGDGTTSTSKNPVKTYPTTGPYTVKLTASTFCTSHTVTKDIIVIAVPVISTQPVDVSVCEGTNVIFSVSASGPVVTHQWQVDQGNGFKNVINTGVYSNATTSSLNITEATADMNGYQYQCIVTNGCSTTSTAATLTINSPPVITTNPLPVSTCLGENISYNVIATGMGLNYQWQENAGSGFVNLNNGGSYSNVKTPALSISGITSDFNNYLYRCVVIGTCPSISSAATVTLNPSPSLISQPASVEIIAGSSSSFSVSATGKDLTYQWQENSGSGFFSLSNNADFSNVTTPTLNMAQVSISKNGVLFRCIVSGACTPAVTCDSVVLTVKNPIPAIISSAGMMATEDLPYTYTLIATDETGNALTYSAPVKPVWLIFNPNTKVLSGIPTNNDVGIHNVTLRVSNGIFSTDQVFAVTVVNTNDEPLITSVPIVSAREDAPYSYSVDALDIDAGSHLTYSVLMKPTWLNFNSETGVLDGTPDNNEVGEHTVSLIVSDGYVEVTQSFVIIVQNINDSPVITSIPITTVDEDTNYNYTITASDVDTNILNYSVLAKPDWLSFNPVTRMLSGLPTREEAGKYQITLRVNDGHVSVDQNFEITVIKIDAPEVTPPTASKPTAISLSNTSFETSISSDEQIGIFTTTDEGSKQHGYQLIQGDGDQNNNLFKIEADQLFINGNTELYSNEFSIRVRSTNSFGNSIDVVFILEKLGPESNLSGIKIPNTFSPNADGINDKWVIKDLQDFSDVSIDVYDRSGISLYSSTNPLQGWDGRMPGGKILEGPFFYIVKFENMVKKGVLISIK